METGVYLSTDSGATWVFKGLSNENGVSCLAIDSSGYIYAGTGNDGIFRIPGRTTPVELISFSAVVNRYNVELSWITATELNNSGFEILRFTQNNDGIWERIGFVEGKGTTTESTAYNYEDKDLNSGSYNYRLKQIDYDGSYTYYNLQETIEISRQFNFKLEQNYPNPFNPTTTINYTIPEDGIVTLKVFDVLGNEVRHLISGEQKTGSHQVKFNAEGLSSGMYFCILNFKGINKENYNSTMKMTIMK
ncbi:MAG: T9SS type A sorting domain-containing protein [Ignavibacteriaceae bacterium]|nr:T9SS type A sorting domain-containing protein [Ignavibacteriaceae bacterium]